MQDAIKQVAYFRHLTLEALGEQHRELSGIDLKTAPDHSRIHTLGTGCNQRMPLLGQRTGDQLNKMNRDDWDMTTAKNRNASFPLILEKSQFLRQGVDPIEGRKIQ